MGMEVKAGEGSGIEEVGIMSERAVLMQLQRTSRFLASKSSSTNQLELSNSQ